MPVRGGVLTNDGLLIINRGTDLVMPNLSGRMVCQAIREIKPEIKVLFCSGYDPEMSGIACLPGRSPTAAWIA